MGRAAHPDGGHPRTIIDSPAAALPSPTGWRPPRSPGAHDVHLGGADFSKGLLDTSGVRGIRRVIDVSGDGPNNAGFPVTGIRDELVAAGIVINGLPIVLKRAGSWGMFDLENLDRYYTDCVIGGTGAFMIPVRETGEFKTATRRKLLLEISGAPVTARIVPVQNPVPGDGDDCMVGERAWRRYFDSP